MNAVNCLQEAFTWLFRPRIRRFILLPLAVNIALFGAGTYTVIRYSETWMNRFLPQDSWLSYFRWLLWPLLAFTLILIIFYTFSLFANLIAAPFNSLLAAAVEKVETGVPPESGYSLGKEILLSIKQECQKMLYFLLLGIPTLIFALIFTPVAPFLWFIYAAWCAALQYMDYPMANHGIVFREQRHKLRQKRTDTLTFGSLAVVLTLIPGLNFIAMPVSVIAATLYWCRTLQQREY